MCTFPSLSVTFPTLLSLLTILTLPATTLSRTEKTESDYFSVFSFRSCSPGSDEWGRLNRILEHGTVRKVEETTLFALSGALLWVSMAKSLPFGIHADNVKSEQAPISLSLFLAFK